MIKLLHFADAHIDMATQGRRDPETGLPVRVLDFLKALDTIVDTAIEERVDLVLFAGDAYKDRTPAPTFQREWGRRIMRLSRAGIPTLLLVGNHDLSPAAGRANAMQEYGTLEVPHVRLIDRPVVLGPDDLYGLPLQVLAMPWIARSGMMAALQISGVEPAQIYNELEARLAELVQGWLESADPNLPVILAAHCSVQGAVYGGERSVMLGSDLVLSGSLVKDPRIDYVALGHIHKYQDLNEGLHPPVIYPGSIERVDFGEVQDEKYFVIAKIEHGSTEYEKRALRGRRFIDRFARVDSSDNFMEDLLAQLPAQDDLRDAMFRLVIEYPRAWDNLLDEQALRRYAEPAFEFHLARRPRMEARLRIPGNQNIGSIKPIDLLDIYWKTMKTDGSDADELQKLAGEIIQGGDPNNDDE
jgi:DNA repair protein SbcD/Mre11